MVAYSVAGAIEHMAMFSVGTLKSRMQTIGSSARLYHGIASMGLAHRIISHRLLLDLQVIQEVFGFFGWWFIW
ncbi:hypothetical protein RHGRI_002135 [Rhododendron griersonianum]|uniref:Uncharacterized protein n=1 Tax=Rhododendron griersonianum TaxID=479676 RepID=A0AAV6LNZ9_9ERIC|nr:hypothetical protein RHGRI_002135 [Rhododendron griersonianum]